MSVLDVQVALRRGTFSLDVSLKIALGETVVLLGPNGAGKTTLLRVIAGLDPFDSGRIVLDNRVLDNRVLDARALDVPQSGDRTPQHVATEERQVAMVFQDHGLFPHLSALDNVAFGLRSKGMGRAESRREAQEWLERLGVADRQSAKPDALSGGQSQRVALARALAIRPRVLLLDEPMSALDVTTRVETRRVLQEQLKDYEGACLIVTHDPLEAMMLADRLVIMEDGRIVQEGSSQEIAEKPTTSYVADLVGVNLFRGHATANQVQLDGVVLTVVEKAEGDVFAVVHPRAVSLHRNQPQGSPRNVWQGVIERLDLEGSRIRVRVGGPSPIVSEVTPSAVAELGLIEGVPVWVSVKATEISVYTT